MTKQLIQVDDATVEVRRSTRRRKTISARREGERIVLLVPAGMPAADELRWARTMSRRVLAQESRRRPPSGPDALQVRAEALATQFLDPHARRPVRASEIRWVGNQHKRWGSCSPDSGVIRLSSRLQEMPDWVVDYVLLHELAHLVEPHHTARFHALVDAHPRAERAKGFLLGWSTASRAQTGPGQPAPDSSAPDDEEEEVD
ncbi:MULTISPECIES: M48 metallopeptidase family protein [unclassified Luteococcus]|uniref:M48 metallopeptidase family protein n=1 Tax=unclassified Luteococcus TaxID=2639923 RepID=UPI00313CD096